MKCFFTQARTVDFYSILSVKIMIIIIFFLKVLQIWPLRSLLVGFCALLLLVLLAKSL